MTDQITPGVDDAPEPKKAILYPVSAAFQCPICEAEGMVELPLDETEEAEWAVPIDERFRSCQSCGEFIDVGWNGWGSLRP